ncbi:MAG: flagellar biosynthesis regulator FlaF [Sneathiella sp.]
MYFEAYKKANRAVERLPLTEYRLFAEITRELELANSTSATSSIKINALFRNSQLWLTLKIDLISENNHLDKQTKAGLISLAIWVNKFTLAAMRNAADLEPLIEVNKQIMQGLNASVKQGSKPVPTSS